jgi:glyoxylase-like metal-dependent hydrolase (beta-lactamase superfamily II)
MKKTTLILTFFFLVLIIQLSRAQQQEAKPVELKQISERLYEILGGRGAQGGMYIGDNEVLVIDAKMDENSVDAVRAEIAKITDKPIKYLVNTHSDGDHVWGNQYFPQTVTFVAHEKCRKEFFHKQRNGNESNWNKPELAAYVPSITFRDRMNIYIGAKKVELWYFGVGHTTGDIVVYFPEEKTAFIGDQIFLTRPQLIHSYKGGNSFGHVKALTRMLETLDAEKFCSGHSEIANRETIKEQINQMQKRQEKIKSLIEKDMSLEEVKKEFEENESRLVEAIYNEIK